MRLRQFWGQPKVLLMVHRIYQQPAQFQMQQRQQLFAQHQQQHQHQHLQQQQQQQQQHQQQQHAAAVAAASAAAAAAAALEPPPQRGAEGSRGHDAATASEIIPALPADDAVNLQRAQAVAQKE